jgi:streptogramin lyase
MQTTAFGRCTGLKNICERAGADKESARLSTTNDVSSVFGLSPRTAELGFFQPGATEEYSVRACCPARTSFSGQFSRFSFMQLRLFSVSFSAVLAILGAGVSAGSLTGCSSTVVESQVGTGGTSGYEGQGFSAKALVGQQPLIGASVELYAAGASGNGANGVGLLSNALITDSTGTFTVPAGYDCPLAGSQIYVVARGGKPGAAASADNDSIALLTALGACNEVALAGPVVINEVTTAAAVYALAQFLSAGGNLGATSTNTVGLKNAVATAQALANISTGGSPGTTFAANGSSPAPKIDTLANLLNSCASATAGGKACNSLFSATAISSGAPLNTLDAALNLVRNPAQNVAALYALASSSSAFTPALAKQPSDWTLFVNYTGGGMNTPTSLGVDSAGNVWVASYINAASEFSPLGAPLFAQGITGSGLGYSFGLAVDANNNVWITNWPSPWAAGNTLSVFNSGGASVAGSSGYSTGAYTYPNGVAIDTDGSAWVADWGDSQLTHLSSAGQELSGSPYSSSQLIDPYVGAIDAGHNVWVSNEGGTTVTRVTQDGSQFTSYDCCNGPEGLAIDQSGNVWVPNFDGDSVSEISSSGAVLSNGGHTSASMADPDDIAIDGAGTVWVCNYRGPSLTELAGSTASVPGTVLSPAVGLGSDAGLLEAYSLAIDASGNLWVSNKGSNTLTEFIGLAAPVRTPQIGPSVAP